MSSINSQALILHPTLSRRASSAPLRGAAQDSAGSADSYVAPQPRNPTPATHQALLSAALQRVRPPSLWRQLGDSAERGTLIAFHNSLDGLAQLTGLDPIQGFLGSWAKLRQYPPQSWFQSFVFGSQAQRIAAYEKLGEHRDWRLFVCVDPVTDKLGMGAGWSPRALIVARGMLHQVLGDVSEQEAITQTRAALEQLKPKAVERRYVGPIRRGDYMLHSVASGDLHERRSETVRYVVECVREILEQLAAHLEDDDTRRRLFEIPKRAYLPKLGVVEAQKKTPESSPSLLSQLFGPSTSASTGGFFSRDGPPWRCAVAVCLGVAAIVGVVVGAVWRKNASGSLSEAQSARS